MQTRKEYQEKIVVRFMKPDAHDTFVLHTRCVYYLEYLYFTVEIGNLLMNTKNIIIRVCSVKQHL